MQGSISCDQSYEVDDTVDPPVYTPGDNFGYGCYAGSGHVYAKQGLYPLVVSAVQGIETAQSGPFPQLVTDLALGGSFSGSGTVLAPAGSGGMYDTDFGGGTVTFDVSATRKPRTAATKVRLTISVPSMTPDWPPTAPPTGLEFRSTSALAPLHVAKTRTTGEVFLRRVEGTVLNSNGSAGTAQAFVHALVQKGQPTLVRIKLQNMSAGYTYLDTGWTEPDLYALTPGVDLLRTGRLKVG
jgi:hypothetical protein